MVRKLILLAMLLTSLSSVAMKIEKDEIDEFTGNRIVYTSWESILGGKSHIRFRLQEDKQSFDFKLIYDNAIVIGRDDNLMFKSTSGEIGKFESVSTYSGGIGEGAVGLAGSQAHGIRATYRGPLSWFDDNIAVLMRLYTTDGYIDNKLSENDGRKLSKLYQLFSSTIDGNPSTTMLTYNLKFVKKRVKGSGWEVVKEETKELITKEELQKIVDEWKSQTSDTMLYDVQIKKEK